MASPTHPDSSKLGEGRYALVSKIGQGGMAAVYRALDRKLRVWRAIKLLQPDIARSSDLRERFEREAQTMALLEHPNLVRIYDVGQREGVPFLVMELVEGGNLDGWVEAYGPMPPRMAVDAVQQIARALTAVHQFDVIHRDVKPNNVLVTPDGVCKLTDFGIARTDAKEDQRKRKLGTQGYTAPEQRSSPATVDARADIYSLGATLWRLLRAQQPQDLFLVDTQPLLLRGIPTRLHPFLVRCLAHRKDRRFASASDVQRALAEIADQLPPIPDGTPPLAQPMEEDEASVPDLSAPFDSDSSLFSPPSAADPQPAHSQPQPHPQSHPQPHPTPAHPTPPSPKAAPPTAGPTVHHRPPDTRPFQAPPPTQPAPPGPHPTSPKAAPPPGIAAAAGATAGAQTGPRTSPKAAPTADPTAADPKPAVPGIVWWISSAIVAASVLGMLTVVTLVVGVNSGRTRINEAQARTQAAGDDLVRLLDDQRALIQSLESDSAERAAIERDYLVLLDARTEADRIAAAIAVVHQLELVLGAKLNARGTSVDAFAMSERLKAIRGARRNYDAAVREWRQSSETIAGQLVVATGMAEPPP